MNEDRSEIRQQEKTIDFCPTIKSFTTEKGSIYKKNTNAEFVRYIYDGTIDLPQEFTLFIDENKTGVDFQMLNHWNPRLNKNMMAVLMQGKVDDPDGLELILRRDQVRNPNSVVIQILNLNNDDILGEQIPATLIPYENADVFEIESLFSEEDKDNIGGTATKTHFGHKVIKIN